jgi:hypothetical protein
MGYSTPQLQPFSHKEGLPVHVRTSPNKKPRRSKPCFVCGHQERQHIRAGWYLARCMVSWCDCRAYVLPTAPPTNRYKADADELAQGKPRSLRSRARSAGLRCARSGADSLGGWWGDQTSPCEWGA